MVLRQSLLILLTISILHLLSCSTCDGVEEEIFKIRKDITKTCILNSGFKWGKEDVPILTKEAKRKDILIQLSFQFKNHTSNKPSFKIWEFETVRENQKYVEEILNAKTTDKIFTSQNIIKKKKINRLGNEFELSIYPKGDAIKTTLLYSYK